MSNIAQDDHRLQAMILTEGEAAGHADGHVYEMYTPHQVAVGRHDPRDGRRELPRRQGGDIIPAVAASARRSRVAADPTVTNCHARAGRQRDCPTAAGQRDRCDRASARFTGEIHSHNTFDLPGRAAAELLDVAVAGASFNLELPPASVSAFQIELG